MYFIKTEQEINGLSKINFIHYNPDLLTDEDKNNGILVEKFADPELMEGKIAVPYYDTVNKQVIFKYEDLPKTTEQQLAEAQKQIADITYTLMIGGLV